MFRGASGAWRRAPSTGGVGGHRPPVRDPHGISSGTGHGETVQNPSESRRTGTALRRSGPKCVSVTPIPAESADSPQTQTHFGPTLRRTPVPTGNPDAFWTTTTGLRRVSTRPAPSPIPPPERGRSHGAWPRAVVADPNLDAPKENQSGPTPLHSKRRTNANPTTCAVISRRTAGSHSTTAEKRRVSRSSMSSSKSRSSNSWMRESIFSLSGIS